VDNIILLSLAELNSSLRRCTTVVKSRGSAQFDSREYEIRSRGRTQLLPIEKNPAVQQPFWQYSSVLSRAPTRFGNPRPGSPIAPQGSE
jgi:hypothetical protein